MGRGGPGLRATFIPVCGALLKGTATSRGVPGGRCGSPWPVGEHSLPKVSAEASYRKDALGQEANESQPSLTDLGLLRPGGWNRAGAPRSCQEQEHVLPGMFLS